MYHQMLVAFDSGSRIQLQQTTEIRGVLLLVSRYHVCCYDPGRGELDSAHKVEEVLESLIFSLFGRVGTVSVWTPKTSECVRKVKDAEGLPLVSSKLTSTSIPRPGWGPANVVGHLASIHILAYLTQNVDSENDTFRRLFPGMAAGARLNESSVLIHNSLSFSLGMT